MFTRLCKHKQYLSQLEYLFINCQFAMKKNDKLKETKQNKNNKNNSNKMNLFLLKENQWLQL